MATNWGTSGDMHPAPHHAYGQPTAGQQQQPMGGYQDPQWGAANAGAGQQQWNAQQQYQQQSSQWQQQPQQQYDQHNQQQYNQNQNQHQQWGPQAQAATGGQQQWGGQQGGHNAAGGAVPGQSAATDYVPPAAPQGGNEVGFQEREDKEGVRWSWTVFPPSRLDAARMVVPLGALITPLKNIPGLPVLRYEPVLCKACKCILNPYSRVDYRGKMWICPFCSAQNGFPHMYQDISENNLPPELYQQYTTVEYSVKPTNPAAPPNAPPPVFVFVIDMCIPTQEELDALRDSLAHALMLLPPDARVAFVTFGMTVQIHDLSDAGANAGGNGSKVYVLRGNKEVTTRELVSFLNPGSAPAAPAPQQPAQKGQTEPAPMLVHPQRFIGILSEVEMVLNSLVENLSFDPWPVESDHRPLRSTGAALSAAIALLESTYKGFGGRIMLFLSGACTHGPGQAVSDDLSEPMRGHNEIKHDTAPFWNRSKKFFDSQVQRCVNNGHTVDVLVGSLDQVGVAEMKGLVQGTGGVLLLNDSFQSKPYQESVKRFFKPLEKDGEGMAFNCTIDVQTTPDWKVSGMIGPCVSKNKRTNCVAEVELGIGGTSQWGVSAMGTNTTYAVYFEPISSGHQPAGVQGRAHRFFQIVTRYQHSNGEYRVRVTTLTHRVSNTQNLAELTMAFDQEATAALLARIAVYKADFEHIYDVMRWLDRILVRFVSKFGEWQKDNPSSLRLRQQLALLPQFMYHLRRSEFLQVFNSSPDETAFFRLELDRETCSNCLIMIQPTLHAYTMAAPPAPVILDSRSVQPDNILLLDTFFEIVVHYGETIASWKNAKYQEKPEYEQFATFLKHPIAEAEALMKDRFPAPLLVECDQRGSQARKLYHKLNPSQTHASVGAEQYTGQAGEIVLTDDASLAQFTEHLKKLAVQQS